MSFCLVFKLIVIKVAFQITNQDGTSSTSQSAPQAPTTVEAKDQLSSRQISEPQVMTFVAPMFVGRDVAYLPFFMNIWIFS